MHRFATRILATLLCFSSATLLWGEDKPPVAELKQILRWLPLETESVIVIKSDCKGGLKEPGFDPVVPCGVDNAMGVIRQGKFVKRWREHAVKFAVHGSGRFDGTKHSWTTYFAGCQIVAFDKETEPGSRELWKAMSEQADASLKLQKRSVLRFDEERGTDKWTFFVTFATPSVLVVATEKDYLQELLERVDRSPLGSFVRDDRLDAAVPWQADLWALRQYSKADMDKGETAGMSGFVFWVSEKKANVRVFAPATRVEDVVKLWTHFPPDEKKPNSVSSAKGVVELVHDFENNEQASATFILLLWRLGHVFGV